MPDQRKITAAIMKAWAPHIAARALGTDPRGNIMHSRLLTQIIPCISRTVIGEPGHSLLQDSMPDDEELNCMPSKRKMLSWTPLAWLNSKFLLFWLTEPSHGLFNIRGLRQGENDSGLDCMELPATRAAYPALANVQTRRMHLQTLHH
jgi:hypothetical protein